MEELRKEQTGATGVNYSLGSLPPLGISPAHEF